MKQDNDILSGRELKEIPYSVPEGYFEDFRKRALRIAAESEAHVAAEKPHGVRRFAPYAAFAATLLIMVTVGTAILKKAEPQDDMDEITAFYNIIPSTDSDAIYYSYNATEEDLSDEEIIDYLIQSGASAEAVEELFQNNF